MSSMGYGAGRFKAGYACTAPRGRGKTLKRKRKWCAHEEHGLKRTRGATYSNVCFSNSVRLERCQLSIIGQER